MKTGLILYMTGSKAVVEMDDDGIRNQVPAWADRVAVVASQTGHFDIHDAWWSMTAAGMHRVVCRTGEILPSGKLMISDRELRLSG